MWVLIRVVTCAAFSAGLIAFGAARAVPPGSASFTAAATCEFRALAAQHPDRRLRNGDTLAGRLCPPQLLPREYEAARDVIDLDPESYAGYFYVNARTRYIDARLTKAIVEGAVQVVILGAGFDSRAYRFHDAHPKIAFFEVDLPATIDAKRRALERALGAVPGYVRYVPLDFDTQTLQSALARAGYEPAARSFFILEGVTMYVSEGGVGATLDFIGQYAAAGSRVVYDYILRRVAEGHYDGLYAARKQALGVASAGEPFVTGWTPQEAAKFAQQHGLAVREELDAAALTRNYLAGSDGKPDGRIPEWYHVIEAEVRKGRRKPS
jgi:methyltransferase (TIGR00027 family)